MRWLVAPVVLLCLAPAAAAEGEDPTGLEAMWDAFAPLLLETPDTTEEVALAAEGGVVFLVAWSEQQAGQGLQNLLRQLPYPVCC